MLLGQCCMHVPRRFLAQRLQLARQALALRLALYDEPAVARPPAGVGEPGESEGPWTPPATLPPSQGRQAAELDQSRFVLMERQAELGQPFFEVRQHPLCISHLLEAHDDVVGVAHDRNPAVCMPAAPLVDPEIKGIVQEDVGEERTDHPSHDLAKLPFDLSVRLAREQLRPAYGEGFLGAPVVICPRSGESRSGFGGADGPARRDGSWPEGPGQP